MTLDRSTGTWHLHKRGGESIADSDRVKYFQGTAPVQQIVLPLPAETIAVVYSSSRPGCTKERF